MFNISSCTEGVSMFNVSPVQRVYRLVCLLMDHHEDQSNSQKKRFQVKILIFRHHFYFIIGFNVIIIIYENCFKKNKYFCYCVDDVRF